MISQYRVHRRLVCLRRWLRRHRDQIAQQLANQLDSLEVASTPQPVLISWLADVSIADRFDAITDDVAGFRDRWLTAEGFVSSINSIFSANDLDVIESLVTDCTFHHMLR